jgi:hypothetical protein
MKKFIISTAIVFSSLAIMAQEGMFGLTYNMAVPLGSTSDYISKFSPRGFGVEGRGFLNDHLSLGGSFAWQTFFEEKIGETPTLDTRTLTGDQFRYINAYPLNFLVHYYFGNYDEAVRFNIGVGVGGIRVNKRTEISVLQIEDNHWHFSVNPEVGILVPFNYSTNLLFSVRYNYAAKSHELSYSYISFNIGLAWY